ncbi:MAG: homogentisate 1,2-dioxygenase [Candidatus Limnocylindrales bacterium]
MEGDRIFYVSRGDIPHKRHTQHRAPDGSLYAEELFGMEGFTGRSSLIYHLRPPTQTHAIEPVAELLPQAAHEPVHRHHLVRSGDMTAHGDVITGRVPLFFNNDVLMGVIRPTESMPSDLFYRNGEADELLFFHQGSGVLQSIFGSLAYEQGDYLIIPIGTTWRLDPDEGVAHRILYLESPTEIVAPRRYRNEYGQLLEHSPVSNRDFRAPVATPARADEGDFTIHLKVRGKLTAYHYRAHPFDAVGWDGYLFPFAFNIADFEPITGRIHQPPPVHQTFAARNYVVCSFVPRRFDYHPLAIPAPYNHSNINSDEVIYYVAGNFMSRRGVEVSSFTVHPGGIPHGPHPGTVEASLGKEGTEELAVMVDTFHPLQLTPEAMAMDDPAYPFSWLPADDGGAEAEGLAQRGPEAFPD